MADVKEDLSGIAKPGQENSQIRERVTSLGIDSFQFAGNPSVFWDFMANKAIPFARRFPIWDRF